MATSSPSLTPIPVDVVSGSSPTDWITATAAFLAVGVAIGVAVWEARRSRLDRTERARQAQRSQAALVNAWIGIWIDEEDSSWLQGHPPYTEGALMVHNASNAAVFDLELLVPRWLDDGESDGFRIWTVRLVTRAAEPQRLSNWIPAKTVTATAVEFTFRDADGIRWHRSVDGFLTESAAVSRPRHPARGRRLALTIRWMAGAVAGLFAALLTWTSVAEFVS